MTIAKDDLERGGIYEIRSRNLLVGAYNGDRGFIGIREKFGDEYLFTEYGPEGGTVGVVKSLLGKVPEEIELREYDEGLWCHTCGKPGTGYPNDTCEGGCSDEERWVGIRMYRPLFDLLKPLHDTLQQVEIKAHQEMIDRAEAARQRRGE